MTPEQQKMCTDKLDRSLVRSRSQAGRSLSYLEGHYVIRRLNTIFGPGGWSYRCMTREVYRERLEDETKSGKVWRWHVSYSSTCVLTIGDCRIEDVGHGHGIDKDCGLAIESAEKEAATDSLKRCAKSLGDSLGLALYDKDQVNVIDPAAVDLVAMFVEAHTLEQLAAAKESARVAWKGLDQPSRDAVGKAQIEAKARIEAVKAA